jgi:thiamine biosynthesis protein ThiS
MSITILLNGQTRDFAALPEETTVAQVIAELQLKGDRIAVERNGEIVQRGDWPVTSVRTGDRLEVVHFVGGG